jgi:hypothetical protein
MTHRKVAKVSHKRLHGHSRRVASAAPKASASEKAESVYTVINGDFRVLFPVTQTTISRKRLSDAVDTVVSKMKT